MGGSGDRFGLPFIPITLAVMAAGLVLLDALIAGPSQDKSGSHQRPQLKRSECNRLYQHQVRVLSTDQNPIHPALQLHRQILQAASSREAQLDYCLKNISRKNFQCQLGANTPEDLFACSRLYPRGLASGENQRTATQGKTSGEKSPGAKKNG